MMTFNDFLIKDEKGNEELNIKDNKGGYVKIVKYSEEAREWDSLLGYVASYTHNNRGGTEQIKTLEDIENNIAGIKRIKRLTEEKKNFCIEYLETFKDLLS